MTIETVVLIVAIVAAWIACTVGVRALALWWYSREDDLLP